MLNKNAVIILKCIMDRDKCDMESAIWFVKHNQTCYEIARAVANIYCDIDDAMRRMQDICAKALHDYKEASGALNKLELKKKMI